MDGNTTMEKIPIQKQVSSSPSDKITESLIELFDELYGQDYMLKPWPYFKLQVLKLNNGLKKNIQQNSSNVRII